MPPHGNAHEEDDALLGGLLDADQLTPGGPDKTTAAMPEEFVARLRKQAERDRLTLLPGRTREEADAARASLAALRGWAARRERFADDRADLMAAA